MITLEDAKDHLRVTHNMEDLYITSLVDAAYSIAETQTGRIFKPVEKTLVLDGLSHGREPIELPWTPIIELLSFEYIDADGMESELDTQKMLLDTRELYPKLYPQWNSLWPKSINEPESVRVTVNAGMATTPPDIRSALLLIIGHLYFNREAVTGSSTAELPMGVNYILGAHEIPRVG